MDRVVEPELMDDEEQATAYAEADFSEPNVRFVEMLEETFGEDALRGHILDLGCGPADIAFAITAKYKEATVLGVDGSAAMLDRARQRASEPGGDRVRLLEKSLPTGALSLERFDLILSNSLLHHLHEPGAHWDTIKANGASGTKVFVGDLFRPESTEVARELVAQHAVGQPDVLRNDFYCSLLAAFRPEEIRAQLAKADLAHFEVKIVSDRHMVIWGEL